MVQQIVKDSKKKARVLEVAGFVKPSGIIVASVTNERNKTYFVQVRSTCATCTCPSRKSCYHVTAVKDAGLPTFAQMTATLDSNYDVVGEALNVFNVASRALDQVALNVEIGDAYEVLAPTKHVFCPCCHKQDTRCAPGRCFWNPDYAQL